MNEKDIIVLDTNTLLVSIALKSPFRPIFDSLLNGDFILAISNEILSEYIEIIEKKTTPGIAQNIASTLMNLDNVRKFDIYFKWELIEDDYDDNKFVDCAIAAGARIIVTNDKHFNILKKIGFPNVEIISAQDFLKELSS